MAQQQWFLGTVKEVLSGDLLVIVGTGQASYTQFPSGCPGVRAEKRLTLSHVLAPRLARRDGSTQDEPCAWQSREHLRRKVVGKQVTFRVDQVLGNSGREFGTVFVQPTPKPSAGDQNGATQQAQPENVALYQVAAGLAKCKENFHSEHDQGLQLQFKQAEEKAKTQGWGIWKGSLEATNTSAPDDKKKKRRAGGGKKKKEKKAAQSSGGSVTQSLPMPRVRKVVQVSQEDAPSLLGKYKDKGLVGCVVESVGNPHVLKVTIPPFVVSPSGGEEPASAADQQEAEEAKRTFTTATVFVCGVSCPLVSKRPSAPAAQAEGEQEKQPAAVPVAEPYSVRSKVFVENLVLNQSGVSLRFEDTDKYGNLYVSVFRTLQSKGGEASEVVNVAEALLKEGLGKTIDWSTRMLSSMTASKLRQAEKSAKQKKQGIWHNFKEQENSNALTDEFKAIVVEVVSGDTLNLWLPQQKLEKRVQLSSIRAPRLPSRGNNNVGEAYAVEAKEFLRQRLIGKEVTCKMEYQRKVPIGGGAPPPPAGSGSEAAATAQQTRILAFANLTLEERAGNPQNVSIMLLVRGLAQTVKHRSEDDMSGVYEDLVEAESKALKQRKGLHSGKKPSPPGRVNDLSSGGSQAKSKQFLPFLQRSDRVHAVVDYVLSGHRFKLNIPKDSLQITFALSDVRCPGRNEAFSDEALKYARLHCMQRDVEIEVDGIDKIGTFTGRLYLPPKSINFSQSLVASGLAKVAGYNVPQGSPLVHAQNRAKDAKLNIWKDYEEPNYDEEALEQEKQANSGSAKEKESMKIRAVNVVSGSVFYAQKVDDQTTSLLEQIGALSLSEASTTGAFQVGEVVLCKYAGDGQVYRAKIEAYDRAAKAYDVFYIDFGNREKAPEKSISPLDLGLKMSSPLAFACQLAFVKAPSLQDDYGYEAAEFLQALIGRGQILAAQVEERVSEVVQGRKPETITKMTLVDPQTNENVALELVRNGLARVESQYKRKGFGHRQTNPSEIVQALQEEEQGAKKDHLNIWQYGDCGSDDEEPPAAWGRR